MLVLSQFLLRLSFGLALGMAVTSSRTVTSGFFKNHLWVVMGLCTLALLVALATPGFPVWPPLAGAILSYVGSICWLYEAKTAGRVLLVLTGGVTLAGAWLLVPVATASLDQTATATLLDSSGAASANQEEIPNEGTATANASTSTLNAAIVCAWLDVPLGGLLLGLTTTAMFLGHWYLNTPTMQLLPLQKLLIWMAIATLLRAVLAGFGLSMELMETDFFTDTGAGTNILLVTLRWLWGIVGVAGLTWMAWQTLKIPNTQSATGILYVAVIGVFLGELTAQLLSARLLYPV